MKPTKDLIYRETGVVAVANRTPGLTKGGNNIILHTASNLGMYEVHTSLTQSDYKSPRWNEYAIANELASQIHPGAISLNHDGGNLRPTGTGWGVIGNVAVSRGYNCARLTDMINSGIPYPGGVSYSNPGALETDVDEFNFIDYCNYNPETDLKRRLDDVDTKYDEKMRITEALLQLEETKK
jgi:hypothetical protein